MELRKTFKFEASHILPKHPGKCSRLHGHSWVLHVFVSGPVNPETGFVMDYADISKVVKPLVESLDHRHLGTYLFQEPMGADLSPGYVYSIHQWAPVGCNYDDRIYPSSENLLWWIGEQLSKPIDKPYTGDSEVNPYWPGLLWSKLALEETCTSYCELTREEFNARGR